MAEQTIPDLPLASEKWQQLVSALQLPPQQARIVELILRNRCDKQIAAALGIKVPTVRTYTHRIYLKTGVCDRLELVLLLFAMSQDIGHFRQ